MATAGPALTCNGYNSVTGQCASTSIPSGVASSQYDEYVSGQAPISTGTSTPVNGTASVDMAPQSAFGNIMSGIDNAIPALGALDNLFGVKPDDPAPGTTGATIANTGQGITSLLSIVTDLPRIATIVIGGVLITAGVFALASQHNINIITPKP